MARRDRGHSRLNVRWTLGGGSVLALAADSTAGIVVITEGVVNTTLMRTRGNLIAWLDGVQAPGQIISVGCGLIVNPGGQGTTVVSSPLTDGEAPWLWYETFVLAYEETVTDVIAVDGISSLRKEVDSKAMRVIRPDREVQFVVETINILGSPPVNVRLSSRFLIGD